MRGGLAAREPRAPKSDSKVEPAAPAVPPPPLPSPPPSASSSEAAAALHVPKGEATHRTTTLSPGSRDPPTGLTASHSGASLDASGSPPSQKTLPGSDASDQRAAAATPPEPLPSAPPPLVSFLSTKVLAAVGALPLLSVPKSTASPLGGDTTEQRGSRLVSAASASRRTPATAVASAAQSTLRAATSKRAETGLWSEPKIPGQEAYQSSFARGGEGEE